MQRTSPAARDSEERYLNRVEFEALLAPILDRVRDRSLDATLTLDLNDAFPAHGDYCRSILAADRVKPKDGSANGRPGASGLAEFDKHSAGKLVHGPGSAYTPTVEGGRAYILYLLPGGAIHFTGP
jgi:hypothetical protein